MIINACVSDYLNLYGTGIKFNTDDTYIVVFGIHQHPDTLPPASTYQTQYEWFLNKYHDKITILFDGFAGNFGQIHKHDSQFNGKRQRILVFEYNG